MKNLEKNNVSEKWREIVGNICTIFLCTLKHLNYKQKYK